MSASAIRSAVIKRRQRRSLEDEMQDLRGGVISYNL